MRSLMALYFEPYDSIVESMHCSQLKENHSTSSAFEEVKSEVACAKIVPNELTFSKDRVSLIIAGKFGGYKQTLTSFQHWQQATAFALHKDQRVEEELLNHQYIDT